MKNSFLAAAMLIASFFIMSSTQAQTSFTFDNATPCGYKVEMKLYDTNYAPCTISLPSPLSVFVAPSTSTTVTLPANTEVADVRFYGCCGQSAGYSIISYFCAPPQITTGDVECFGNPVTFNFVQPDLIEISN